MLLAESLRFTDFTWLQSCGIALRKLCGSICLNASFRQTLILTGFSINPINTLIRQERTEGNTSGILEVILNAPGLAENEISLLQVLVTSKCWNLSCSTSSRVVAS
jgi:hypothetical protein